MLLVWRRWECLILDPALSLGMSRVTAFEDKTFYDFVVTVIWQIFSNSWMDTRQVSCRVQEGEGLQFDSHANGFHNVCVCVNKTFLIMIRLHERQCLSMTGWIGNSRSWKWCSCKHSCCNICSCFCSRMGWQIILFNHWYAPFHSFFPLCPVCIAYVCVNISEATVTNFCCQNKIK